jgi:hypothetical protein
MDRLQYGDALQYGFPRTPKPGQRVIDGAGSVWEWHEDSSGLSALGFWGKLWDGIKKVGRAALPFIPVVGTIASAGLETILAIKDAKQRQKALEEYNRQLAAQQAAEAAKTGAGGLNKKTLLYIAIGLMVVMMMDK